MKIYTKGGDTGRTSIHGGQRTDKDDIRIEALGTLDELNAQIGVVRSLLPSEHEWQEVLHRIQKDLMTVMSQVATPPSLRATNSNPLPGDLTLFCEREIDLLSEQMGESTYFILPGGTAVASHLQLARTVARRAERRLCTLHKSGDDLPSCILSFINRLSDLFFTQARYELFTHGKPEERWHAFLYKKRLATKQNTTNDGRADNNDRR
jgi:ATP:cob(I)alamin adenosyltransferase